MWIKKVLYGNIMLWITVLSLLAVFPGMAEATTLVVNSTVDAADATPGDGSCVTSGGPCSLRAAIEEANALAGDDTISLPAGTYTLSLGAELTISSNLTLTGAGADTTIIEAATTAGTASASVINITGGTVAISGVSIRHGNLTNQPGGGIINFGTMTIDDTVISDNVSSLSDGGGVFNNGTMTITNSTISENTVTKNGGAIFNAGTLNITNSTISGNTGASVTQGSATFSGGGIGNQGSLTLVNSTITSNTASAGAGGGLSSNAGSSVLTNTILAGNTAPTGPDCFGTLTSQGFNLIQNTSGCTISGDTTGNITGQDPKLGPLQDNGGPTFTHELLAGSPAIDAGDNAAAPATDQRGTTRPQGAVSDIGAFELVTGASVPSLSEWGLIVMAFLLVALFGWRGRRLARRERV